jgi:hypothetical protein
VFDAVAPAGLPQLPSEVHDANCAQAFRTPALFVRYVPERVFAILDRSVGSCGALAPKS